MARVSNISPALKKRAAQIKVLLMDVDGTMTDGSVTLLSQWDGTALEIKTFDAHDGQGLTLAQTAGLRTGLYYRPRKCCAPLPSPRNEDGIYLHEAAHKDAGL